MPLRPGEGVFASRTGCRRYSGPIRIVETLRIDEVMDCLRCVEHIVEQGHHAMGFVSYEAAEAFDPAYTTKRATDFPLLWFALFDKVDEAQIVPAVKPMRPPQSWRPLVHKGAYLDSLARVRHWIASGDTYQANITFPIRATCDVDAFQWFLRLYEAQPVDYAAYVDAGRWKIVSASPELFFRLNGDRIETRPMKGTALRGLSYAADQHNAAALRGSQKDRAENLMIVDLIRNDLGRIAKVGSVEVSRLFEVERYNTLWQMTSTVSAATEANVSEIFRALFPSGSVTGAPKIRTMEIIDVIESFPRGVYCGAVGWLAPGRQAQFNVAIRTATIDTATKTALYHVGSAVTWGSHAESEYEECLAKASVLNREITQFRLLESLRWDGDFYLLDRHLKRLEQSADYFEFEVDMTRVTTALKEAVLDLLPGSYKVRLLLDKDGAIDVQTEPCIARDRILAGFAPFPIDKQDVFLYHKTTQRDVYTRARRACPQWDDVILWNEQGEVTESTIANIVIELNGRRLTPALSSGLLPGTMREHLLSTQEIAEAVITKNDLRRATAIWLVNSVRKWMTVDLMTEALPLEATGP